MATDPTDPAYQGGPVHPGVAPDPNRTVIMPQGAPITNSVPSAPPAWNTPATPHGVGPSAGTATSAARTRGPATLVLFGAAALTLLAMFLPLVVVGDESASVFSAVKGTFAFYCVLAALMVVVGLMSKRGLYVLSLLIGLAVAALALNYRSDASTFEITAGSGIWVLLAGGVVCIVASIIGLFRSK